MVKITTSNKALLTRGTELILNYSNPAARTIQLIQTGDLDSDGVTLQALYARLMDLWNTEADLPPIPFPLEQITEEKMDLIRNWNFADDTTRYLIRDGGWAVRDNAGAATEMWAGIVSLGAIGATDQPYFQQVNSSAAAVNFQLTGPINQAIQILKTGAGAFDRRNYLKLFAREQGKTYAQASLLDAGVPLLDYRRIPFPLSNAVDTKIVASDSTIDTTAPYTGMSITYHATNQTRNISGTNYNYNVIINGNNATAEQIYTYVQRQLRRNADIDAGAGTVTGLTADSLLRFVGDNLITSTGVFIDNYQPADINRITFTDVNGIGRKFTFTAAGVITFNQVIQNDPVAKYYLYYVNFTGDPGDEYGNTGAVLVNNALGVPIQGDVDGDPSKSFTFNWGSLPDDAAIEVVCVVVGGSVNGTQFASSGTQTITRSTANVIPVSGSLDRVYA